MLFPPLTKEELEIYAQSFIGMIEKGSLKECFISLRHAQTEEKLDAILKQLTGEDWNDIRNDQSNIQEWSYYQL